MAISGTDFSATLSLTDTVNTLNDVSIAVNNTGMSLGALITLINNAITNVNDLNAKLDLDGGVNDEDYADTYNLTVLSTRNNANERGIHQGDLYDALAEIETNFNGILTKLDADTGVADEDYNETYAVDLNDFASGTGISQDDIVSFLDSFVANYNATLTKLDADE